MGGQGQLGQMPTVRNDHHGHLGLIWRITGLQKDCFKVKASILHILLLWGRLEHPDAPGDVRNGLSFLQGHP